MNGNVKVYDFGRELNRILIDKNKIMSEILDSKKEETKPELYTVLCDGLTTDEAFALLPMNTMFKRDDNYNYCYGFNLKRDYYDEVWTAQYVCIQKLSKTIEAKADKPKQAIVKLYNKLIEMNLIEPCT